VTSGTKQPQDSVPGNGVTDPHEAKRFRHFAIAIHQVAVGDVVFAGPGKQYAQPQQRDLAYRRTVVCQQVRQPVDRRIRYHRDLRQRP
jgi:hypothetical protein